MPGRDVDAQQFMGEFDARRIPHRVVIGRAGIFVPRDDRGWLECGDGIEGCQPGRA
jgi:hypothetical protein